MHHLKDNRFARFLLAGGVNTLFGFAVYSGTILAGGPIWLALLAGILAGIAFNFLTTGGYVFRDLSSRRFPRFLLAYLLIYLVNLGLIALLSRWIIHPILAQAIITAPIAIASYLLMARFVFCEGKN
ncbi:GtrA-like protein [compost metagenome]